MSQGQHIITVGLSNAIGESPKSSAEVYAGFDTPAAVTGITTSVDGSNVTISWNAPAGIINGGTLDYSKISYDVVRNPGASVVAEGTKDLSVTDVIPDGFVKTYSYTISVVFDGETGQNATSEALAIGKPYTVPYLQDFGSIENFAEAESISAVAGCQWRRLYMWKPGEIDGNKCAVVDVISGTKHDYALFTAPMTLRAGVNYTLKFKIAYGATYASTGIRIFLSKSQSINENDNIYPFIDPNLSFRIFDANDTNKFKEQTYSFTAPEDGTYSIGFYETFGNRFDSQSIFIDDIEVTGIFPCPTAATDVTATQLEHGSRTIDVAFTLPSKRRQRQRPRINKQSGNLLRQQRPCGFVRAEFRQQPICPWRKGILPHRRSSSRIPVLQSGGLQRRIGIGSLNQRSGLLRIFSTTSRSLT